MSQWVECATEIKVVNEEVLKRAVALANDILTQEKARLKCVHGVIRAYCEVGVSVKDGKLVFARNDTQRMDEVEKVMGVVKSTYQATLIRSQLSKLGLKTGRNFEIKSASRSRGAWRMRVVAR